MTKTSYAVAFALLISAVFVPHALKAQDELAIEEIIVTARQRSESLEDVPATVSVLTAEQIERSGVQRAEDFIYLTPGVSIVNAAEVADTQVNIRGINGARDAENSFALIIDGILMTNPAALNREYSDLQQIEVMKGPQGALYGRNAAAGAIIITTGDLRDELGGKVKASFAEDSTYVVSGNVSGPVNDNMRFGLNADYRQSDGYYRNTFLGQPVVDDFENWNVTGRLQWDVSDKLTIDSKLRYGEVDAASISFDSAFALPIVQPIFGVPQLFEDVNAHQFSFHTNIDPFNEQEALEFSVKADYDMDWATLNAWFLFSDIDNSLGSDGTSGAFGFFNADATCRQSSADLFAAGVTLPPPQVLGAVPDFPVSIFGPYTSTACDGTQYQERNQRDYSFEVRLSSPGDQQLRWQTGFYYLNIDREVGVNTGIDRGNGIVRSLFVPASGLNPTEQVLWDQFDSDVIAVFGNIAYDMSDTVELSFALRYDRESRDVTSLVPTDARTQYIDFTNDGIPSGGAPLTPALNPDINPSGVIAPKSEEFDQLQPKISITWDALENLTFFTSLGIGFKSGGFNNTGSAATVDLFLNLPLGTNVGTRDVFDEETSKALEFGLKSDWLDRRVRWDATFYHTRVDDMQNFEFLVGPFGLLRVVNNIDEVEITGFETSISARVNDYLDVYAGANWNDSEINRNRTRPTTVGNESPYTPDYTYNLGASLNVPMSNGMEWFASADLSIVGSTWFHVVQAQTNPTLFDFAFQFLGFPPGFGEADYTLTQRDSYSILNARVGLRGDNWSVAAFAKNLADEDYLEEVIPAPEFGGSFIHPGSQRRAGVEFTYEF